MRRHRATPLHCSMICYVGVPHGVEQTARSSPKLAILDRPRLSAASCLFLSYLPFSPSQTAARLTAARPSVSPTPCTLRPRGPRGGTAPSSMGSLRWQASERDFCADFARMAARQGGDASALGSATNASYFGNPRIARPSRRCVGRVGWGLRGHMQQFQWLTAQRRFDPSSLCSANLPMQPVLRSFAWPKFLVVFEGCSEGPPHYAHADTAEIRSLWADILRTCSLWVIWWGALRHCFSATFLGMSPSEFVRIYGLRRSLRSNYARIAAQRHVQTIPGRVRLVSLSDPTRALSPRPLRS